MLTRLVIYIRKSHKNVLETLYRAAKLFGTLPYDKVMLQTSEKAFTKKGVQYFFWLSLTNYS